MENSIEKKEGISLQKYTTMVFGRMALGLLTTFIVMCIFINLLLTSYSFYVTFIDNLQLISLLTFGIQIALAITLGSKLFSMSKGMSYVLFFVYAGVVGITFSLIAVLGLIIKEMILAFLLTTILFSCAAFIGLTTKRDMMKWQSFLTMGVIFLFVSNLIMMFFNLPMMYHIVSSIGVIVFIVYTAYDTQKIKKNFYMYETDEVALDKIAIYSAFQLYLDFINLFIYVLRILLSKRR